MDKIKYNKSTRHIQHEMDVQEARDMLYNAMKKLEKVVSEEVAKFALKAYGLQAGDEVEIVSKVDGSHIAFLTIHRITIDQNDYPYAIMTGGGAHFLDELRKVTKE